MTLNENVRRMADAAEKANELAQKVLENQEKSLANMEQLKNSSQALELNLMENSDDRH
jgi:methyl-accepting chemotaxis protein